MLLPVNGIVSIEESNSNDTRTASKNIVVEEGNLDDMDVAINHEGDELALYEYFRITSEKAITRPPATFTIDGAPFASPGNVSGVAALPKGGKTSFISLLQASALSGDGSANGSPNIKSTPNYEDLGVLNFDSEQSEDNSQDLVNAVLRRNGHSQTPGNYFFYNIRQLSFSEYQTVVTNICKLVADRCKGIHSIYFDLSTAFVLDVNISEDCVAVMKFFTWLAIQFNCPVILSMHLNFGTTKERGHFGSELQRICYAMVHLTKIKDTFKLVPQFFRKHALGTISPISFELDPDRGYLVETTAVDDILIQKKHSHKLENICAQIFKANDRLKNKELISKVMQLASVQNRMAQMKIREMVGNGFIIKDLDGSYSLKSKDMI